MLVQIALDVICRPLHSGELEVLNIQSMILSLWTKRARTIMISEEDPAIKVLECCGTCLDLERCIVPEHGASVFWQGLRRAFPQVQLHLFARLGDSSLFHYWLDDRSNGGTLCVEKTLPLC